MRMSADNSEFRRAGEEVALPPEIPETLNDPALRGADDPQGRTILPETARSEVSDPMGTSAENGAPSGKKRGSWADDHIVKRQKSLLLQMAAAAATVVLVTNSFGLDFLKVNGLFNDSVIFADVKEFEYWDEWSEWEHSHHDSEPTVDFSSLKGIGGERVFPSLPNPAPNPEIEGYGVLNEEYIVYTRNGERVTVYADPGHNGPEPVYSGEGFVYDVEENTLRLEGVTGGAFEINLMGNGFKLQVEGENSLDYLLVYGFHAGGSLTITGTGRLTVNEDRRYAYGITMNAEYSKTCLMIDKEVSLDIYGSGTTPVWIENTSAELGIYSLQKRLAGIRQQYLEQTSPEGDSTKYRIWVITDDKGNWNVDRLTIPAE